MSHGGVVGHPGPTAWLLPVAVLAVLTVPYLRAAAGVRTGTGHRWSRARTAAFVGGALGVALAVSPLVHETTGPAASHMVQHVLLGMAAPLALVLAAPVTLVLAALPPARRRPAVRALASRPVRALAHPVTAAALHVGGLYALYLTPLHALTQRSAAAHHAVLVHLLGAGCLFAWSLVGPERAARRPGTAWRVGVLVAASAAHGYLAKLLYARAPLLPPGSGLEAADLRAAAQGMYYAGDVAEVALAVALLGPAYRRAARRRSVPPGRTTAARRPA